jgi:hypothetical protein
MSNPHDVVQKQADAFHSNLDPVLDAAIAFARHYGVPVAIAFRHPATNEIRFLEFPHHWFPRRSDPDGLERLMVPKTADLMPQHRACPDCGGDGHSGVMPPPEANQMYYPCETCRGTGRVRK